MSVLPVMEMTWGLTETRHHMTFSLSYDCMSHLCFYGLFYQNVNVYILCESEGGRKFALQIYIN